MSISEEDFFEMNFSYENSPKENLREALKVLYQKYKSAEEFSEELCSGVCMDDAESEVVLQSVIMAYKFVCRFLAESGARIQGGIIEALKASANSEQYCSHII